MTKMVFLRHETALCMQKFRKLHELSTLLEACTEQLIALSTHQLLVKSA